MVGVRTTNEFTCLNEVGVLRTKVISERGNALR